MLVIVLPTIALIVGFFLYPYPAAALANSVVLVLFFAGPIVLCAGFLWRERQTGRKIKIAGWVLVALFWAAQPSHLYLSEGGDIFNAAVCVFGVYVLMYLAYHEWLSLSDPREIPCLNWLAGTASLCALVYYTMENTQLARLLIDVVATQSVGLVNVLTGSSFSVITFTPYGAPVFDAQGVNVVTIIFACTAVQSMVLFGGMIVALPKVSLRRKAVALSVTVLPIYVLNLLRNDLVIFLMGNHITSFDIAHNVLSKAGALVTLVLLLFAVFKLLPELYDQILDLLNLPKQKGPLEEVFERK